MKKLLSLVISALMAVSAFAVCAVPAMAEETVNSPTASVIISPVVQVNGQNNSSDVKYSQSANDPYTVTFYYEGRGRLGGWEYNLQTLGFTEGTDFTASENKDGSLTLTFVSESAKAALEDGKVVVNAVVDTTGTDTDADKNDSSKSPETGIATSAIAGGVALAAAGLAVLSAKKKDAE